MHDQKRRQVVKSIAAASMTAAGMTTLPAMARVTTQSTVSQDSAPVSDPVNGRDISVKGPGIDVHIESSNGEFRIRLGNRSDASVTVKHVHPGIVHAEGNIFDINSVLENYNLTLKSGAAVELPITATNAHATEKAWPADITVSRPASVTTYLEHSYAGANNAIKVSTNRRFFS